MEATTIEIRKSFELSNNRKRSKIRNCETRLTVFRGEVKALSPYVRKGDRADNQ